MQVSPQQQVSYHMDSIVEMIADLMTESTHAEKETVALGMLQSGCAN